jgi:hypothetical protein
MTAACVSLISEALLYSLPARPNVVGVNSLMLTETPLPSSSFLPDEQKETYVQLIKERFSRIY